MTCLKRYDDAVGESLVLEMINYIAIERGAVMSKKCRKKVYMNDLIV